MVEYIMHMGSDDTVCDAARVSMDKTADMFDVKQNAKLITYLAKHNHWSPFSHVTVQMRFNAPIFIARQLQKHQVGFAWNEVSRRYVSTEPKMWFPKEFRTKADNVKQGSANTVHQHSHLYLTDMHAVCDKALMLYQDMIENGVCAEQARAVLPQSMMTEWIWTGSLYAWSRMHNLRIDPHAQSEVRDYAVDVGRVCSNLFPISWSALTEAH